MEREIGSQKDVIFKVVDLLRSYHKEPMDISDIKAEIDEVDEDYREQAIIDAVTTKMMVCLVSEITDFGIVPHTEMYEAFNKER